MQEHIDELTERLEWLNGRCSTTVASREEIKEWKYVLQQLVWAREYQKKNEEREKKAK